MEGWGGQGVAVNRSSADKEDRSMRSRLLAVVVALLLASGCASGAADADLRRLTSERDALQAKAAVAAEAAKAAAQVDALQGD